MTNDEPEIDIPNDPNVSPEDIEPDAYLRDVDLTNAQLSEVDLTKANLMNADLTNAQLSEADLINAKLSGADLSEANLKYADLTVAQLSGADLSEANLRNADLTNANLKRADLSDTILTDANLTGAALFNTIVTDEQLATAQFEYHIPKDDEISPSDIVSDADLTNAWLEYADLSGANLSHADLSGANLRYANLTNASLFEADLSGANLGHADLSDASLGVADLTNANLRNADLTNAGLFEADLSGANLGGADLTNVWLEDADLPDVNLLHADLTEMRTDYLRETNLAGADLRYADLTNIDLTDADLSGAQLDNATLSRASLRNADFASVDIRHTLLPDWALFGRVASMDLAPDSNDDVDLRTAPIADVFIITGGPPASLREAALQRADLEDADFRFSDLREATLTSTDCENTQFNNANLNRAGFENADLTGANLAQAYLYQTRFDGAQIDEETQFHPDGEVGDTTTENACRYDSRVPPETSAESVAEGVAADSDADIEKIRARRARSTYTRLRDLARENGFPDLKSEMHIRRQDARRELLWAQGQWPRAIFAQIQKSLFKYGESFSRIVGISAAAIFIVWILYLTTSTVETAAGVVVTTDAVVDNPILVWETLYHSLSVFFAGQGSLSPTGTPGQVLTILLRATGPILVALLIFVLGRRAAR